MPDKTNMVKRCTDTFLVSDQPFERRIAAIPDASRNPKMLALFRQMDSVDFSVLLLLDEGYLQEEIAARLGISQQAVSKRIGKIKKLLI